MYKNVFILEMTTIILCRTLQRSVGVEEWLHKKLNDDHVIKRTV